MTLCPTGRIGRLRHTVRGDRWTRGGMPGPEGEALGLRPDPQGTRLRVPPAAALPALLSAPDQEVWVQSPVYLTPV